MPETTAHIGPRRLSGVVLWVAWATVLWAGISVFLLRIQTPMPRLVELLMTLSGGIAIIGGCLATLYLVAFARSLRPVLLGVCAAAANFSYAWWYVRAVVHQ